MQFLRVMPLALIACGYTPPPPSSGGIDAPVDVLGEGAPASDLHLLLTELAVFGGADVAEFVEIYNPTDHAIALDDYYLSDEQTYWKLPAHVASPPQIILLDSDFLVKFPAGSTIAADAVVVVAIDGPDFVAAYQSTPTFTITTPTSGAMAMDATVATPGVMAERLSNDGEMLVLFQWDGASDVVRDVDIVVHGKAPTSTNVLAVKAPTDGPDAGGTPTAYADDALSLVDMTKDSATGESYKRIAREGALELRTAGNGITGHDETSEDERTTWDSGSLGVTPGVIPPALR